jgi:hypothetical protein
MEEKCMEFEGVHVDGWGRAINVDSKGLSRSRD